ncbi:MAG: omptin family outer membrane protease [Spirochaetia bacterium]|nr:omptin family outer membrane protease [Spirochaetia bacterium]
MAFILAIILTTSANLGEIHLTDNTVIKAEIVRVGRSHIEYRFSEDSEILEVYRDSVKKIVYPSGEILEFSSNENKLTNDNSFSFNDLSLKIGIKSEYLLGDTTYQLGGYYTTSTGKSGNARFPLSELSFPVNTYNLSGMISFIFLKNFTLSTIMTFNLNKDPGKLKDYDWGIYYGDPEIPNATQNSLDIYSESKLKIKYQFIETLLRYNSKLFSNFFFISQLGYTRQNFSFEGKDAVQSYPSSEEYFAIKKANRFLEGTVITYDANYNILSFSGGLGYSFFDNFNTSLQFGFMPYVFIKDRDDHVIRYKLFESKTYGQGFLAIFETNYEILSVVTISLAAAYKKISSTGRQTQTFYKTTEDANAGDTAEVDSKVFSVQNTISIMVEYTLF